MSTRSNQKPALGQRTGVTYLHYTVPMSPNKEETTVHCCGPALSVLVMFDVPKRLSLISISQEVYCLNLGPRYGHAKLVRGYLVLTGVN